MKHWWKLGLLGLLLLAGGIWLLMRGNKTQPQPASAPVSESVAVAEKTVSEEPPRRLIRATEIEGVGSAYEFSGEVPSGWQAEWVPETEAINLYDPAADAGSNLERSQIFIRSFKADRFLTLQTVTVHEREETTVDGRPAVRYDIEKKSTVADFPNQPSWRNQRHIVTDIRVSDDSPSIFYVIASRPDLDQTIYDHFLNSLKIVDTQLTVVDPVDDFVKRVTKKPFGILISPRNSPVQPERFSGYHTGADAEFDPSTQLGAGDEGEIEVRAIADGTVNQSSTADGYGGVVVIDHKIDGQRYQVVYGHLDPADLPTVGDSVKQGDRIGKLGDGDTAETDGERKHLHLGLFKGSEPNLRGYVSTESELEQWTDPKTLFE